MVRIEISDELNATLDQIKSSNYRISGKGHTDTIAFLVDQYERNKTIETVLNRYMESIQKTVADSVDHSFKNTLKRIFTFGGSDQ